MDPPHLSEHIGLWFAGFRSVLEMPHKIAVLRLRHSKLLFAGSNENV